MFNYHHKTVWRNNVRDKQFSLLHMPGLSIGFTCAWLIYLRITDELSVDKLEIGIRKVIGATAGSVVVNLSKDFLILVSISLLIAVPLSWWFMNNGLQTFTYRISISPFVFLITVFSVILVTLLTISLQSVKGAIASPVKSLRTE